MRLSLVGPTYPYKGGGARHATELAHRLAAAGHQVVLESWRAQYPKRLYPGEQTVAAPEFPLFEPTRRELAWYRPDGWVRAGRRAGRDTEGVILSVFSPVQVPPYLGLLAGVARRARVVALCNNVLPHERRAVDVAAMRLLLRLVDGVFVHSAAQASLARSLTARPVAFEPLAPHLPVPAQALPVPQEPFRRLLFFGFVRPYKGLDVLLRALAAGPEGVALRVAGEFWGGTGETEQLITELGLAERVQLRPGYLPDAELAALFADVDALVLPYRAATSSQNAWIAHQFGVPVIATRAGALADPIRDGVDGLVCAPGDVPSLASALRRFYSPGEALRLRRAVVPVDPDPYWERYVDTLVRLAAGGAAQVTVAGSHDGGGPWRG